MIGSPSVGQGVVDVEHEMLEREVVPPGMVTRRSSDDHDRALGVMGDAVGG
jgi:hypothetical protein